MSGEIWRRAFNGMRRATVAAAVLGGLWHSGGAQAQGRTEFQVTRSSSFYRMIVDTAYQGKPLRIEVVVACQVKVTSSPLTGVSRDPARAPSPLYAVRMDDNKAIAVQTVDACKGETTDDGRVPADFLPLLIVYSSADDMTFGIAYMTEDAYQNSRAELRRPTVTIKRSNANEWRAWRATAPRNALRPEMRERQLIPGRTVFGHNCLSMRRLEIPDKIRNKIKAIWPSDRPQYWRPSGRDQDVLRTILWGNKSPSPGSIHSPLFEGRPWTSYFVRDAARGMPTRDGGGQIRNTRSERTGEYSTSTYPMKFDLGVPWIGPHLHSQMSFYWDIEVEPESMGFGYCYTLMRGNESAFGGPYDSAPRTKLWVCRINGRELLASFDCDVDTLVFEESRFVFQMLVINLNAIEGID